MRGRMILETGNHYIDEAIYIGSMSVVGKRNFIAGATFKALYNKIVDLFVKNIL